MDRLTVWYNTALAGLAATRLREGLAGHDLVHAAASLAPGPSKGVPDDALAAADVAFGQPDPDQLLNLPRLRWLHLSSAGYTPYDREDIWAALRQRGVVVTKSSAVYADPCAAHVLALMMAHTRQLHAAHAAQLGSHDWRQGTLRAKSRLLAGQRVLIFGFGEIARRLVELLAPLRVSIVGVRRTVAGGEPVPMVAIDDPKLPAALAAADHMINLLPGTPATRSFFGGSRFGAMKPGAIFYNIGRGTTVDQEALTAALASGYLGAAYLDVTDPEPLPPGHPLWTTPRCFITPHTAGGDADEPLRLVDHFLDNFLRFAAGRPLLERIQ